MEDRLLEITDAEQKREKRSKTNEEHLRELWDNVKRTNTHIIGVPEGEERERRGQKKYSKRYHPRYTSFWNSKSLPKVLSFSVFFRIWKSLGQIGRAHV